MPEQLDPHPANPAPLPAGAPQSSREQLPPFPSAADVLEVSPLHGEIMAELRWAHEQLQRGAFDGYVGQYLAIVNKTVQAVGDAGARDEAAKKAGVAPERVALFYVGGE